MAFESGERMPVLVHSQDGMPVFDACVYAATVVRPKSGSSATIDQALRGVQFLLSFADLRGIDIRERFTASQFLESHELDDLVRMAYRPMADFNKCQSDLLATMSRPVKGGTLDQVLKRAPKVNGNATVSINTASVRLHYLRTYLEWLGNSIAGQICTTMEQKQHYRDSLNACLDMLRARTPRSRAGSNRTALSQTQKDVLIDVIAPDSPDNPWSGDFLCDRNRLLVVWGLGTGLRRGELLGLRIRLIDFRRNMVDIVRRPDDKNDPRKHQPNTKTRERGIGISEELAYLTHQHIVRYRSKIKGAQKHDFLFVAAGTGRPLSLSGMSKVFRSLRHTHPAVGEELSSHVLRHTWNEDFSNMADSAKLSAADERRARGHAMGWSETSNSADHYLKRRTARQATDVSIKMQQAIVNKGVEHDLD
jgi:integrase